MRRWIAIATLSVLFFLWGCKSQDSHLSGAIEFRSKLVQAQGCAFQAAVTADFETEILRFLLDCDTDAQGNVSFTLLEPETLAGITATVSKGGGKITYDGLSVDFGLLAQESIAPAAAPALILDSWISGYILSAGETEGLYVVSYEQEFEGMLLEVESIFKNELPISAEICYNDRRILAVQISEFQFH